MKLQSYHFENDQVPVFERPSGIFPSGELKARETQTEIQQSRELISSVGKLLPAPNEDIPDLTEFAEELLDDPVSEQIISGASPEKLAKIESALTQRIQTLADELQTLESSIQKILETEPSNETHFLDDLKRNMEGKTLEQQVELILNASREKNTETGIAQVITTPELASAIWQRMSTDFERANDSYTSWDQNASKKYFSLVRYSRYLETECLKTLEGQFGKYFGKKILRPEYQSELAQFSDFLLRERINGTRLVKEPLSLSQVIVARETFGTVERLRSLCEAFNIGKHLKDWDPKEKKEILTFGHATFWEKGMTSNINAHFEVQKNDDYAEVDRDLVLDIKFDEAQEQAVNRMHVVHGAFRLPDELQNQGIAKRVLHDSFAWYLEQKEYGCTVADVALLANVGVGGYAWAAYGFGWNKERLALKESDLLKKETGKKSTLTPDELWTSGLKRHVKECQRRAEMFFRKVSNLTTEMRTSLLDELEAAMQDLSHPLTADLVTPQRLAAIGRTGPEFVRVQDEEQNEYWYPDTGNIQGTVKERMHLGKAMSLGLSWHGILNLEPKTSVERDQLSLLKQRVAL